MRKFSERHFKIPIRLYKSSDIDAEVERKEDLGVDIDEDIDYVVGYVKLNPFSIDEWFDCFSRPRSIDDVKADGFDCTRVVTKKGEVYDCIWERRKFEAKLDAFVEELEKEYEAEENKVLALISAEDKKIEL